MVIQQEITSYGLGTCVTA